MRVFAAHDVGQARSRRRYRHVLPLVRWRARVLHADGICDALRGLDSSQERYVRSSRISSAVEACEPLLRFRACRYDFSVLTLSCLIAFLSYSFERHPVEPPRFVRGWARLLGRRVGLRVRRRRPQRGLYLHRQHRLLRQVDAGRASGKLVLPVCVRVRT